VWRAGVVLWMSTRRVATISFGIALVSAAGMALAAEPKTPCNEDAMIVFDASDSRSGTVALGIASPLARIDEVRSADCHKDASLWSDHLWPRAVSALQRPSRPPAHA